MKELEPPRPSAAKTLHDLKLYRESSEGLGHAKMLRKLSFLKVIM